MAWWCDHRISEVEDLPQLQALTDVQLTLLFAPLRLRGRTLRKILAAVATLRGEAAAFMPSWAQLSPLMSMATAGEVLAWSLNHVVSQTHDWQLIFRSSASEETAAMMMMMMWDDDDDVGMWWIICIWMRLSALADKRINWEK
jgi:hypothetical protein